MNELLGLAVGIIVIIIVILLAVFYFKRKDCPNKKPEFVYNDKCEIISCSDITKHVYNGKCYRKDDACEIDDAVANGGYKITNDGSCMLTSCEIEDAFVVGDKCIKKGDVCSEGNLPENSDPNGNYTTTDDGSCILFSCKNEYDLKGGACGCTGNKQVVDGKCVCQKKNPSGGCYDIGESCDPTGSTVENGIYKIDDDAYGCNIDSCTEGTDKYTFTLNEARDKCDMKCKDRWSDPTKNCETCNGFVKGVECLAENTVCAAGSASPLDFRYEKKVYLVDNIYKCQTCPEGKKLKKAKWSIFKTCQDI